MQEKDFEKRVQEFERRPATLDAKIVDGFVEVTLTWNMLFPAGNDFVESDVERRTILIDPNREISEQYLFAYSGWLGMAVSDMEGRQDFVFLVTEAMKKAREDNH